MHELSRAEREVLELLAEGYRYDEIARIRFSSRRTVKHQAYSAKFKLGARTMTQAVVRFVAGHRVA